MSEFGRLVCTSIFNDDNGKTVNVTGTSTSFSAVGTITDGKYVVEVPTREKYKVEVIGEIERQFLVTPADPEDPESVDVYETRTEEVTEFTGYAVMTDGGYAEIEVGLDPKDWRGIKNIVRAHLEMDYFKIGDEVDLELLDKTHHPMVVAAINHADDAEYHPHQVIFVSKYCLAEARPFNYVREFNAPADKSSVLWDLNHGRFWSLLPDDVKAVISPRRIQVAAGHYSSAGLTEITPKIWLPKYGELWHVKIGGNGVEFDATTQFGLFTTNGARARATAANPTQNVQWWTQSPRQDGNYPMERVVVDVYGSATVSTQVPEYLNYVLPCFHVTDA